MLVTSPSVIRLDTVDSTQSVAFALAAVGAPDRTVVVADYQTIGRGRSGRTWYAAPGTSLLASILVRPCGGTSQVPLLAFVAAVAVAGALRCLVGVDARLKWPNDVLIRCRKVAGILVETRTICHGSTRDEADERAPNLRGSSCFVSGDRCLDTEASAATAVVIGIGLNLSQRVFPHEVAGRATSLLLETGIDVAASDALPVVLGEFDAWRWRFEREGFAPVRERWLTLAETLGERLNVDRVAGAPVDLAIDSALVVTDGVRRQPVVAKDAG